MKFIFTIDALKLIGVVVCIGILILGFIIYWIAIGLDKASKKIKKKVRKEEKENNNT